VRWITCRVGDWGRCAGSAEAYARLTHLGGSSAAGASSAILVSSDSVPDRFRRTIVDYRRRTDFWCRFFGFPKEDLIPIADGQQ
jgi:hypothetical protein